MIRFAEKNDPVSRGLAKPPHAAKSSGEGLKRDDDKEHVVGIEKAAAAKVPEAPPLAELMAEHNIRVAVVGNVDAGKSTLIGTLMTGCVDDGRGRARSTIVRFKHEMETGRTSTVTSHLLGMDANGKTLSMTAGKKGMAFLREDEVAEKAHKVVTLMDLAGHEKYLKTTIHGVSTGMADYALVLVNSRHLPTHMTLQHLNLCCAYGIPIIVVLTKVDGCPKHVLKSTKEQVSAMLRSPDVGRRPFAVRKAEDIGICVEKTSALAPVVAVSAVSGEGLDLLTQLLFQLPKRRRHFKNKVDRPFEFLVEDVFPNVPGVGLVVSGFVNSGHLRVGDETLLVGPMNDGSFCRVTTRSAHVARTSVDTVVAGQSACLALGSLPKKAVVRRLFRRGMVLVKERAFGRSDDCNEHNDKAVWSFGAEVCVLKGEGTTIRQGVYETMVHILHVRQSARVESIEFLSNEDDNNNFAAFRGGNVASDGVVLRPGNRALVRFRFTKRPEYIRPGMRVLFRDGCVRGIGIVKEL